MIIAAVNKQRERGRSEEKSACECVVGEGERTQRGDTLQVNLIDRSVSAGLMCH